MKNALVASIFSLIAVCCAWTDGKANGEPYVNISVENKDGRIESC